jgi:hypothetical protein
VFLRNTSEFIAAASTAAPLLSMVLRTLAVRYFNKLFRCIITSIPLNPQVFTVSLYYFFRDKRLECLREIKENSILFTSAYPNAKVMDRLVRPAKDFRTESSRY